MIEEHKPYLNFENNDTSGDMLASLKNRKNLKIQFCRAWSLKSKILFLINQGFERVQNLIQREG